MKKQILSIFIGLALSGISINANAETNNCQSNNVSGGQTCIVSQDLINRLAQSVDSADIFSATGSKATSSSNNSIVIKDIIFPSYSKTRFTTAKVFNGAISDDGFADGNSLIMENSTLKNFYGTVITTYNPKILERKIVKNSLISATDSYIKETLELVVMDNRRDSLTDAHVDTLDNKITLNNVTVDGFSKFLISENFNTQNGRDLLADNKNNSININDSSFKKSSTIEILASGTNTGSLHDNNINIKNSKFLDGSYITTANGYQLNHATSVINNNNINIEGSEFTGNSKIYIYDLYASNSGDIHSALTVKDSVFN